MLPYASTIFLSAFLLFLVQPVISKQVLPWFGGSASVWTTCLVFFQMTLLAGYAYADLCVRRLTPRRQAVLQSILLIGSIAVLPIVPGAQWRPTGNEDPSWRVLAMLAGTIGLPYLLLSTTSPFVQSWFTRANPGANPYRLFALSNLASMLALLGYPFLFEPWAPTRSQALIWSAAYGVFVCLCVATAWISVGRNGSRGAERAHAIGPVGIADAQSVRPAFSRMALWVVLAATASMLLLAVTNQITRNIAAVPLLWIAPLAVYLLTFILTFDGSRWYRRGLVIPLAGAALVAMALPLQAFGLAHELVTEIGVFLVGLFLACLFAHGELARLKPAPQHLTVFYLMVSLGGATGSALVGIVAPLVLPAYFELPAGLVLCALLMYWQVRPEPVARRAIAIAVTLATVFCATMNVQSFFADTVLATRNFYGVLRVQEQTGGAEERHRTLTDGTTVHGMQFVNAPMSKRPTAYFTPTSGIGRLLASLSRGDSPARVGIVGLGAGTLAAYGRPGDTYRFYEINPDVVVVANEQFTFLDDSAAAIETVLGDARLTLEREAPQRFDVLAIDAFSSDAIPVHLMTFEAVALYRRHMRPGGVIAFHVSNRFLDLVPVVEALGNAHGLYSVSIFDAAGTTPGARPSDWVLLAESPERLQRFGMADVPQPLQAHGSDRLWTDDFNNLIQVLK